MPQAYTSSTCHKLPKSLSTGAVARQSVNVGCSVQENTEVWPWEVVVLIGWLVFLRILVYVALRFKTAAPTAQNVH